MDSNISGFFRYVCKDCDIPKLNVLYQISLAQDSKNHDKLLVR